MNAVIFLGPVRAITTITSATVPLVHQSFSPLRTQCFPSSLNTALVDSPAGSLPTPVSVSANAEIAPLASMGKYFFFCASVPNSLRGTGTPIDWLADTSAVRLPSTLVIFATALVYISCDNPSPPYSSGILIPKAPIAFSSSTTSAGTLASRSIWSPSTLSARKRSSFARNGAAFATSSGVGSGKG
jgi:hypothetical protein